MVGIRIRFKRKSDNYTNSPDRVIIIIYFTTLKTWTGAETFPMLKKEPIRLELLPLLALFNVCNSDLFRKNDLLKLRSYRDS